MAEGRMISNARGTDTLPHVIIKGQNVLRSDLPTDHPAFKAAVPNLPALNRGDEEGLAAAMLMTARQTPRQIFSAVSLGNICRQYGNDPLAHQHVRGTIWEYSTMMTTVDLRDRADKPRCADGQGRLAGAIFSDDEAALNARRISLVIWVEIPGNWQRAIFMLEEIVDMCPQLQTMHIDITTERNLAVSQGVRREILRCKEYWIQGRDIATTTVATVVGDDE